MPQAGALMAANLAGWFCSIYLVQEMLGVQTMAVLAVANQWLTLILMPATSWSGLILKEMADLSLTTEGRRQMTGKVRDVMIRNVSVTLLLAVAVVLGSPWLASAYRLDGLGLTTVIAVSAMAALVMSAALVMQNTMITLNKQWEWMACTCVGLLAQLLFTWLCVRHGAWTVQMGLMISALLSGGLALVWVWRCRWMVQD